MGQVLLGCGGLGQGADPVRNHPRRWSPSSWDTSPPCGPDTARWCRSWRWPLTFYNLFFSLTMFSLSLSLPLSLALDFSSLVVFSCWAASIFRSMHTPPFFQTHTNTSYTHAYMIQSFRHSFFPCFLLCMCCFLFLCAHLHFLIWFLIIYWLLRFFFTFLLELDDRQIVL